MSALPVPADLASRAGHTTDEALALSYGVSVSTVYRWRSAAGLPAYARPVPKHGTNSRYAGGCRCERCRAARAQYMREYRAHLYQ